MRLEHIINHNFESTALTIRTNRTQASVIVVDNECPVYAYINNLKRETSKTTARRTLSALAKHLGQESIYAIRWGNFDRNGINSLLGLLQDKGLTPDTLRLYLSVVKGVLREAYFLDQITTKQYERIRAVSISASPRRKKHQILEKDKVPGLIENIESTCRHKTTAIRNKTMLLTLIFSGLRRSELTGLTLEQLDMGARRLTVVGKGGKVRIVPIPRLAFDSLVLWLAYRGHEPGYLFLPVNKSGKVLSADKQESPMDTSTIYQLCKQYGLISQTSKIAPHSLRRSYATWLHRDGVSLKDIKEMLGHSSITTTEIYVQTDYEQAENAVLSSLDEF